MVYEVGDEIRVTDPLSPHYAKIAKVINVGKPNHMYGYLYTVEFLTGETDTLVNAEISHKI